MDVKCCETCFASKKQVATQQFRRICNGMYNSSEVFLEENFQIAQLKQFNYDCDTVTDFKFFDGLGNILYKCISDSGVPIHTHIHTQTHTHTAL